MAGRKLSKLADVIQHRFPYLHVSLEKADRAQWRNRLIVRTDGGDILLDYVRTGGRYETDVVEDWLKEYTKKLSYPNPLEAQEALEKARKVEPAPPLFEKQLMEPDSIDDLSIEEELRVRRRAIERLFLNGHSGRGLAQALSQELKRDYSLEEIRHDIENVCKNLATNEDNERVAFRARGRLQLHAAARFLWKERLFGQWTKVQRLIAAIEGNDAPIKIEMEKSETAFEGWTIEELDTFAATGLAPERLRKKLRGGGRILTNDDDDQILH